MWQEHQYVGLNSSASPARSLANVPWQVPRCLLQASPFTGRFHTSQRHKPHGFLYEYAECSWAIGHMNEPCSPPLMATSLFGLSGWPGWPPFLGFSGGEDSGVGAGVAKAGVLSAAGVTPRGERRSRKGPASHPLHLSSQ